MLQAKIKSYDGEYLTLKPSSPIDRELLKKQVDDVEIRLVDGREISALQRRKIFAIIRDIADWSGHAPEYIREILTWKMREPDGREAFSLSNCDMTTATEFIAFLIEFCFRFNVPTKKPLGELCDDIERYLYACLLHRKCAVCNKKAEIHHVDRIGMGRDREKIIHVGLNAVALCREHHNQAHQNEKKLFAEYHIKGIKLDETILKGAEK